MNVAHLAERLVWRGPGAGSIPCSGKELFGDEVLLNVLGCLRHIRDKLRPMLKHGSIKLHVRGSQKAH